MKFIKKYYLLLLLIIILTGISLYGTYAMFTSEIGIDAFKLEASTIPVDQEIMEYEKITINANDSKTISLNVSNSTNQILHYGAWYQMINPSTINNNITIAKLTDSPDETSGTIDGNSNKKVYIYIGNNTSSTITLYIGIKYSETSSLGLPDNRFLITNTRDGKFLVNISVTNGKSDLTSKKINKGNSTTFKVTPNSGYEFENVSCTNSSANYNQNTNTLTITNIKGNVNCNVKFKKLPRTSKEMLTYLGLKSNGIKETITSPATSNEGIWETQDDYGTTYYFRGNVVNNYVKFAGYYWRIIRINGDGSIRMIYDGTSAHTNGENSSDRRIGSSKYNNNYNDNAYIGYMYGQAASNNYSATHKNTNSSTVKTAVDNWYKKNIADKGYGDYVADVIYCADRKISTTGSWSGYGKLGYGSNNTLYDPSSRTLSSSSNYWASTQQIKMTCSQKNDRFTVNDTTNGNGALTYPVGLITVDEALAAGGKGGTSNNSYYLNIGISYWTMSPCDYRGTFPLVFFIYGSNGAVMAGDTSGGSTIRPVISLKSSVILTGNGTQSNPWVVQ